MKRFLIFLLIFLTIPISCFAFDFDSREYESTLDTFNLSSFEEKLDKDTYNALKELGIAEFDYNKITSLSIDDIASILKETLLNKSQKPFSSCMIIVVFVIISCLMQSLKDDDDSLNQTYSTVAVLVISTTIMVKLSTTISSSIMALSVASNFFYAFAPALAIIIVASGNYVTGVSTNTLLLTLAQGMSFVSSNVFMPLINCFLALGICSSLRYELHLNKLMSTIRKIITTCISFTCAVFTSVLSIKTAVSSRADIIGLRSIRFAINSVVPIIGSSISEGLVTIQGYSSLIKSSVGVVGIIAVCLVFLPSIFEVAMWRLSLLFCSIIADAFGDNGVSTVLSAFKDTMLLVNVVLILSMVTTVISIGILIAAGGNA